MHWFRRREKEKHILGVDKSFYSYSCVTAYYFLMTCLSLSFLFCMYDVVGGEGGGEEKGNTKRHFHSQNQRDSFIILAIKTHAWAHPQGLFS